MVYFGRAKTAKEMYTNAQEYEDTEIAKMTNSIDDYVEYSRTGETPTTTTASNYSTTEQIVGKWIDGSNIYGKMLDLGYSFNIDTSDTQIPSNILPTDISMPIKAIYYIIGDNKSIMVSDPAEIFTEDNSNYYCRAMKPWGSRETRHVYLYIEYTK